jgi:hypothetical protein
MKKLLLAGVAAPLMATSAFCMDREKQFTGSVTQQGTASNPLNGTRQKGDEI